MKKISLILFLCIIAFSILRAEDKSVIKLIPVYEKTFQDTIVDVIFDTATVNIEEAKEMGWKEEAFDEEERVKGKATISYPNILMTGRGEGNIKEIIFYSKSGQIKRRIHVSKTEKVIRSEEGHYILKAKRYNEFNLSQQGAVLYDWNGNVVWEKDKGVFKAVSDSGYSATGFVSVDGSWYPFKIYNSKGVEVESLNLNYNNIIDAGGRFSGDYFVVCAWIKNRKTHIVIIPLQSKKSRMDRIIDDWVNQNDVEIFNTTGIIVGRPLMIIDWSGKINKLALLKKIPPGFITVWSVKNNEIHLYVDGGQLVIIKGGKIENQITLEPNVKRAKKYIYKVISNKIVLKKLERVEK